MLRGRSGRRRRRHGRRRGRLPARPAWPPARSRRTPAVPTRRARADRRHPRRPRAAQAARARCWSASPPRPSDLRRQRRRQAGPQGRRPHRRQRRLGARGRLRARHQRRGHPRAPTAASVEVPLTDKRQVARAVLDVVESPAAPSRRGGPSVGSVTSRRCGRGHHDATASEPRRTGAHGDQLDLHLGVGDRGPSRQDGRPDLRLRSSTPCSTEDPPSRVACETLRHHRPVHRGRARSRPRPTSTSPASCARRSATSATTASQLRLRRQHLRRDGRHRRAVARHRPGRGRLRGGPRRHVRRGRAEPSRAPATRG